MMKRSFSVITVVCVAILVCNCASFRTQTKSNNNTDQIIGVWKMVSPGWPVGEVRKIITKGHFLLILTMPDNTIGASFGGTYSFDGETYIENIEFGTQNRISNIGRKGVLKVKFEDNKMFSAGQLEEGRFLYDEVWERVE